MERRWLADRSSLSFMERRSVREGFEPSVELLRPYNGLANRRLRPLGHLTMSMRTTHYSGPYSGRTRPNEKLTICSSSRRRALAWAREALRRGLTETPVHICGRSGNDTQVHGLDSVDRKILTKWCRYCFNTTTSASTARKSLNEFEDTAAARATPDDFGLLTG